MTKFLVFVAWVLLLTLCPMPTGVRVGLGFVVGVWYLSAFFRHSDKDGKGSNGQSPDSEDKTGQTNQVN